MLATGRWSQLDRLRGAADPVMLLTRIPGIGPDLTRRIHDRLGIETLEALGRVAAQVRPPARHRPDIADLLAIDAQYRRQAHSGEQRLIAPKRFDPRRESWLPIMHAQRGEWHYSALFSNTARAHELDRTHDWIVIYYYDDDHVEAQCTVVTEATGGLRGQRVVCGRERECEEHYAKQGDGGTTPAAGSSAG